MKIGIWGYKMAHFESLQKVRFQHCDPAGIVFYPRYFEMINAVVENWFDEILQVPFSVLHFDRGLAVPTVSIKTDFLAPSRLDDELCMTLDVLNLGGSSLNLNIKALCGAQERLSADVTLVCVAKETIRPTRWPDDIRSQVEKHLKETP